jgi:chitin disaccharide deacetylase
MRSENKTIVNADDFGYDMTINKAILDSFRSSLVTRTSLLVNMSGFEYAIQMARDYPYLSGKIGLHINLTEGYPLTTPILSCRRFCDESGQFIYKRRTPIFFLSKKEQEAIYGELKAQIEKIIDAGVQPSHLDSHHHVHTEWAILKLIIRLGKEYRVTNIRLARNMGRQRRRLFMAYKFILNSYLTHYPGIHVTDYFGDIEDFTLLMEGMHLKKKSIEIMVHPKFNKRGELVDYDGKDLHGKLESLKDTLYTRSPIDL